jgi:Flp pilus assembly protein TadD
MPNLASASRLFLVAGCLMMSACAGTDSRPVAANAPPAAVLDEKGRIQMRLADSAREAGNFPYAAKLYRTLAQSQPNNAPLHVSLGDALTGTGDFEAAEEAYRDAIAIDRFSIDARLGLGRVAMQLRQPDLAVVQFGAVVDQQPNDTRGHVGLGVAFDTLGRHADAQKEYRAALAINPGSKTATNNLGLSLALAGRPAEGEALLEPLVDGPASTPRLRQNLALVLGLKGDSSRAAQLVRGDLNEQDSRGNLAFYEAARHLAGGN